MNTATVWLRREDVETEVHPVTSVLREVIDRIPDEGFAGDPAEIRSRADDAIESVADAMADDQFAAAKTTLEEGFLPVAREGVRAEYDACTAVCHRNARKSCYSCP